MTLTSLKGGKPYPLDYLPGPGDPPAVQGGNCTCDNSFINELANDFLSALPIIANVRPTMLNYHLCVT